MYGDARTLGYLPRRAKSTELRQPTRQSVRAEGSRGRGARLSELFGVQLIPSPNCLELELQVYGFPRIWFCFGAVEPCYAVVLLCGNGNVYSMPYVLNDHS